MPALPPSRMPKPSKMPIPMRLRFLRLKIILRPDIMPLYSRRGRESQIAKCKSKTERTSQKSNRKCQMAKLWKSKSKGKTQKAKVRPKEQVKRQNANRKRQKSNAKKDQFCPMRKKASQKAKRKSQKAKVRLKEQVTRQSAGGALSLCASTPLASESGNIIRL